MRRMTKQQRARTLAAAARLRRKPKEGASSSRARGCQAKMHKDTRQRTYARSVGWGVDLCLPRLPACHGEALTAEPAAIPKGRPGMDDERSPTSQRARTQDVRRREVLALLVRGHTKVEITRRIRCDRSTVDRDIAVIEAAKDPELSRVRTEVERAAWDVVDAATRAGDHSAVTGALRLLARIRGIDKGDTLNLNVDAGPLEVRFVEPGSDDE